MWCHNMPLMAWLYRKYSHNFLFMDKTIAIHLHLIYLSLMCSINAIHVFRLLLKDLVLFPLTGIMMLIPPVCIACNLWDC